MSVLLKAISVLVLGCCLIAVVNSVEEDVTTKYTLDTDSLHLQGDAYTNSVNGTDYFYLTDFAYDSVGTGVVKRTLVTQLGLLTSNVSIQFELFTGGSEESFYGKAFKWNVGASSGCLLRNEVNVQCRGLQVEFSGQNDTEGVYVYVNGTLSATGGSNVMARARNTWISVYIDMYTYGQSDVHSIDVYMDGKSLFKENMIFFEDTDFNTGDSTTDTGLSNKMTFFALTCDEDDSTKCYDEHIVRNIVFYSTAETNSTANSTEAPTVSPAPTSSPTRAVTASPTASPTSPCRLKTTEYNLTTTDFTTTGDGYIDGQYMVLNADEFGTGGGVIILEDIAEEFKIIKNNISIGFDVYYGGSSNESGAFLSWSYGTSEKCLEKSYINDQNCGGVIVAFVTTDAVEFYGDKNKGVVVYANGSLIESTNTSDYYGEWVHMNIKTYAHADGETYHGEVYLNNERIVEHFAFTKGHLSEYTLGNQTNKYLFYGQTCNNHTGGHCADGHVVSNVHVNVTKWSCGSGSKSGSSSTAAPTSSTSAPTSSTSAPTYPTAVPTPSPTHKPKPTRSPTPAPTKATGPTATPTRATSPTVSPTLAPTKKPHVPPTMHPTAAPVTNSPTSSTSAPTHPTITPTAVPSSHPTPSPTHKPKPTRSPTPAPTKATGPTATPTKATSPTVSPTLAPTKKPHVPPTMHPTAAPVTNSPTSSTSAPTTANPTVAQWHGYPTKSPTAVPSSQPTPSPTHKPKPTRSPTPAPTKATGPTATPTKATSPTVSPTLAPTKKPHVPPTMHPTAAPVTNSPTSTFEWSFYIDHLELMFDAYKKGHHIHLTDNKKDQFGLAFIPPKLSDLLGYGTYGVNLTFNVTFGSASDCSGVGFVVDYGTRISCLFAAEASNHDDITDPTCDGISLGLISDPSASGIYVAKQDSIQYAGSSTSFEDKQTEIRMEYTHDSTLGYDYMKFYLDGVAVSDTVQFSTDYIAQGTRIPPKVTFVATTTDCSEAHALSAFEGKLGLEMEKVLTLHEQQLMIELLGLQHEQDTTDLHALYDRFATKASLLDGTLSTGFLVTVAVVAVIALFVRKGLAVASGRVIYSPL